jgi:hypothetical protein
LQLSGFSICNYRWQSGRISLSGWNVQEQANRVFGDLRLPLALDLVSGCREPAEIASEAPYLLSPVWVMFFSCNPLIFFQKRL